MPLEQLEEVCLRKVKTDTDGHVHESLSQSFVDFVHLNNVLLFCLIFFFF